MNSRSRFIEGVEHDLQQIEAEITRLEEQFGADIDDDLAADEEALLTRLRQHARLVEDALRQLRSAEGAEWQAAVAHAERARARLLDAYREFHAAL